MLRTLRLFIVLIVTISSKAFAQQAPATEAPVIAEEAQQLLSEMQVCVSETRHFCVVKAGTQLLTSLDVLEAIWAQDPEQVQALRKNFDVSSMAVLGTGRPELRKFVAENGLWVSDYLIARFLPQVDDGFSYDTVRHEMAVYQLMRAQACDETQNEACAASALWAVNNAINAGRWDAVTAQYGLSSLDAIKILGVLLERYEDQI